MNTRRTRLAALSAGMLGASVLAAQVSQHPVSTFESAEITIDHRADADGFIRVRLEPVGRSPIDTIVDVLKRDGENEIAENISRALSVAAAQEFEIRRNGETVHIDRPNRDSPSFSVEITFNAPGLSILLTD